MDDCVFKTKKIQTNKIIWNDRAQTAVRNLKSFSLIYISLFFFLIRFIFVCVVTNHRERDCDIRIDNKPSGRFSNIYISFSHTHFHTESMRISTDIRNIKFITKCIDISVFRHSSSHRYVHLTQVFVSQISFQSTFVFQFRIETCMKKWRKKIRRGVCLLFFLNCILFLLLLLLCSSCCLFLFLTHTDILSSPQFFTFICLFF